MTIWINVSSRFLNSLFTKHKHKKEPVDLLQMSKFIF